MEIITKIPITIINDGSYQPHFYLKWDTCDKRYRVSTSFKYLNAKYKLHINIIRSDKKEFDSYTFKYLSSLIKKHSTVFFEQYNIADKPEMYIFRDESTTTELFLIERTFGGITNSTVVFFSRAFWSLKDFLEYFKELNSEEIQQMATKSNTISKDN